VSGLNGTLTDWADLARRLEDHPEVLGVAPYVQGQAMLVNGQQVSGALIRGVLPGEEPEVSEVNEHMVAGTLGALEPGGYGMILGSELAASLAVMPGGKITVITPEANVTPAGVLPRLRRFEVIGIFEVGMYEYDRTTAFIHIEDAARLFHLNDAVSGLRLKLDDLFRAPLITRELVSELEERYWVSDWTQQHANFFRAVNTEKIMMFIILSLIVAVAAFNIVSTLVMVVTDKQADIAILRTLGLTPSRVMTIFIIQGTLIGLFGTLLGIAGGVTLALNVETLVPLIENLLGMQFLPADVYYISDLPSDLHLDDVVTIAVIAFVLTVVATLYPAWRAARTQPAEALRYE
ncbi:MAG: lipoprotein-releasing ABC transporter permease subunit, partial [Longimicrobiales bacterium]